MDAIDRTNLDARGIFDVYAGLDDDVCHVPQGYHAPINARI